jgi:hypothetical protein
MVGYQGVDLLKGYNPTLIDSLIDIAEKSIHKSVPNLFCRVYKRQNMITVLPHPGPLWVRNF